MKNISALCVVVLLLLLGAPAALRAQTADATIDKLAQAIQSSDASAIQELLSEKVEITMPPSTDGEYSRNQALFIVREFFMNYPAQSFSILHRGNNAGTHYAMGKYTSQRAQFDVNLFLRKYGNGYQVYQIRFDQTN